MDRFKITNVAWDSDKDPGGYSKWINTFSALVRATAHGAPLEDYLDAKLNRRKQLRMAIPSCITDDPDFYDEETDQQRFNPAPGGLDSAQSTPAPNGPQASPLIGGAGPSQASGATGGTFGLGKAQIPFRDLPDATKELDGMLYNILLMNLKGSKNALLFCVKDPSYVQACIVLSKHINISRNERKTKVLEAFDKLRFTGNVQAYQIESMGVITELFDSGVTMMDYALSKIMKSFEGKSKTIQYQIAHDINTKDIDDNLNLYDLIQGYCAQIATVGDMQVSVGAVENTTADETRRPKPTGAQPERPNNRCPYCEKKGHTLANCWAKQIDAGETTSAPKCGHCGKLGHNEDKCRGKEAGTPRTTTAPQDPAPVVNAVNVGRSGLSSGGLRHLVNYLSVDVNNVNMCNANDAGVKPAAKYPGPTPIKSQDNLTCTSPKPGAAYTYDSLISNIGQVASLKSRQDLINANTAHTATITETDGIPEHDDHTVLPPDHHEGKEPESQLPEASAKHLVQDIRSHYLEKVKISVPNQEVDSLTHQTTAADAAITIPKDLTVINGLRVGDEHTSDDDAPGTLKQQPAEEVRQLDPKGNKRYRDPQTGIWDTPLTRRHARMMAAELRGADQERANESGTVSVKLTDPIAHDDIDPPYTGPHTAAAITQQYPTIGADLPVTTNSAKDQDITTPNRTYLDAAKPQPPTPANKQWRVNSVSADAKSGAYKHNPNETNSSQYHKSEDDPDTAKLNKQNDISFKDPGVLEGNKQQHTPSTYQIFPTEVTDTADSTKVQDDTNQTELTPPFKGHNRTMTKNALASLTNMLSVTAFNYMKTGQKEPPDTKTQHDFMRGECKVNNPFDHLDQAESYPVDEDNPTEYSAKEYKIYSTSD